MLTNSIRTVSIVLLVLIQYAVNLQCVPFICGHKIHRFINSSLKPKDLEGNPEDQLVDSSLIGIYPPALPIPPQSLAQDYIALIKKRHWDLMSDSYNLMPYFCRAVVADYSSGSLLASDSAGWCPAADIKFRQWISGNLVHTQLHEAFNGFPGRDPWGRDKLLPVYKKLLPSEMAAMNIHLDKPGGKCTSLASYFLAAMRKNGVPAGDVILLRTKGHTIGLARCNDTIYLADNTKIMRIWYHSLFDLTRYLFVGAFNENAYCKTEFLIDDRILNSPKGTLQEDLGRYYGLQYHKVSRLNSDEDMHSYPCYDYDCLAQRYAYQSLAVVNPGLYLKASVEGPHVRRLARQVKNTEQAVEWIRNHIANGSIFQDHESRIMIADQVIVFRKGDAKDRALLLASIMRLKGCKVSVILCTRNAYVKIEDELIDVCSWEQAAAPLDTILVVE